MERFTVTETFPCGLSQRPIFEQKESSTPYTSFPPKSPTRDISFSTYTIPGEPRLLAQERIMRRIDGTEISIFDAERYFNEDRDQKEKKQTSTLTVNLDRIPDRSSLSTISRLSSVSSVDGYRRNYKSGSFHATPTASSEASWNSQSGLLSIPPGSIAVSMRDLPLNGKTRGPSKKWLFVTRCPCSGKKSVLVDEKSSNPKNPFHPNDSSSSSLNPKKQSSATEEGAVDRVVAKEKARVVDKNMVINEPTELKSISRNHLWSESGHRMVSSGRLVADVGGFSFPILNPPVLEYPARESLEVFRPSESTELQRSLQSFTLPTTPKTRANIADDDIASDTSSDLFEIESFSTQTTMNHPLYRRRDSLDEFSSNDGRRILQFQRSLDGIMTSSIEATETECYEPSEVSIDWSVTTAEGFDRGSVTNLSTATTAAASEYEVNVQKESEKIGINNGRKKGNGLLSCRCEKAVNVGPHPVKQGPDDHPRAGAGAGVGSPVVFVESRQIPAKLRLANLSSMHRARASGKPPIARSNSARMSPAFITE